MRSTVLLIIIFICSNSNAQNNCYEWAERSGNSGNESGVSIATNANGHVFSTGYFEETYDADPSVSVTNLINNGERDIFINKHDAFGHFLWAVAIGGALNDMPGSIGVDDSGNVYVTGTFEDTVDFDPSVGVYNLISNGEVDVFVLKLDPQGNLVWALSYGGPRYDVGAALAINGNDLFIAGGFMDMVDFNPNSGTTNLINTNSNYNMFLQKLDVSGVFHWARHFEGSSAIYISDMLIDSNDDVAITGLFDGTYDFNPGSNDFEIVSMSYYDGFIVKVDSDANFHWAKAIQGAFWKAPHSIAADSLNNYYVAGWHEGTTDFDPGPGIVSEMGDGKDAFVLKLSVDGDFEWVNVLNEFGDQRVQGITVTPDQRVVVAGRFSGIVDFDPSASVFELGTVFTSDVFVQEIDVNGDFVDAFPINGSGYQWVEDLTTDTWGNVFMTGRFSDSCYFDPSVGVTDFVALADNDAFLVKYNNCGPNAELSNLSQGSFNLYPNPASDYVTIDLNSIPNHDFQVQIVSASGAVVNSYNLSPDVSSINIEALTPGVYVVSIGSKEEGIYREKLVVE